jgi:hypothetical protein
VKYIVNPKLQGEPMATALATLLEERLERGAAVLFDMEQRGDTGPEYQRWLETWLELLRQYEGENAA